jgi:hypothetical protein
MKISIIGAIRYGKGLISEPSATASVISSRKNKEALSGFVEPGDNASQ